MTEQDIIERALGCWPQYTSDTIPPQILSAVRDRMVREAREARKASVCITDQFED